MSLIMLDYTLLDRFESILSNNYMAYISYFPPLHLCMKILHHRYLFWYRCGIGEYSEVHIESRLKERIVKGEFVGVEGIPALGVYEGKYSNLNPCFLEVSDIRWYRNERYPCKFSIKFYGDYIPYKSSQFLGEIRGYGRETLFFELEENIWDRMVRSLSIVVPHWWNKLRYH